MQTVIYNGRFDDFLCAVFDVYEYRFIEVEIITGARFKGNIFEKVHFANHDPKHSERVLKGLRQKLSPEAQQQVYRTFLSEITGIENVLLEYIRYAFASEQSIEADFSNNAVLTITQTAKKVWREKHRMEAFVRFQKTADQLFYATVAPDYNVLPLIAGHFTNRYADQSWLIYDTRRHWGLYYDLKTVEEVQLAFSDNTGDGKNIRSVFEENEEAYQKLWQVYFKSVNIPARKNKKLHLQHMPKRYWKYLTEKQGF